MMDFLRRLFGPPPVTATFDRLRPGRSILEGTVRADGPLLRSPLKNVPCIAFYYRAWYKAQSRGRFVDRLLKEVEVYASSYTLEMDGGRVSVVPARPGSFEPAEHQQLVAVAGEGFHAHEQLVRPGDRVRIHGRLRIDGEAAVLRPDRIDLIGSSDSSPTARKSVKKKR